MKSILSLFTLLLVTGLAADPGDSSRLINTLDLGYPVHTVDFSPDGNFLVVAGAAARAEVYHAQFGIRIKALESRYTATINVARFSPDGRLLAIGDEGGNLLVRDVDSGRIIHELKGHELGVTDLAFSPDGFYLASVGRDKKSIIWNLVSGRQVLLIDRHAYALAGVAFVGEGKELLTASEDRQLRRWSVTDGRLLGSSVAHQGAICDLRWSPSAQLAVTGGKDDKIIGWDIKADATDFELMGHRGDILCVAFNPDGTLLASSGEDRQLKLWDLASGKLVLDLSESAHGRAVKEVAFSADGTVLVSGGQDGKIHFWEVPLLPERVKLLVDRQVADWIYDNRPNNPADLPDHQRKGEKKRGQFQQELEKEMTTFFEKHVDWASTLKVGKYNEDYGYFYVTSDLLGPLRMIVDPLDLKKVQKNLDRLEFSFLDMTIADGRLEVVSLVAFLRGKQRRFVVKP